MLAIGSRGTATSRLVLRQSRARELLGRAYNRAIQLSVVPGISELATVVVAPAATVVGDERSIGLSRELLHAVTAISRAVDATSARP